MALHTIVGANGIIGAALASMLRYYGEEVRTISNTPLTIQGTDPHVVDLLNYEHLVRTVAGSSHVYLTADLPYRTQTLEEEWPPLVRNAINACKEACGKLIFLDRTHLYSKVDGPVTEQSLLRPPGRKGKVLAAATFLLQKEIAEGNIDATIARTSDYYGPGVVGHDTIGALVFARLLQRKKPSWLIHPDIPRSLHYLPDLTRALYLLATNQEATGKVWHLPSAMPAITGREFALLAASYMNATCKGVHTWRSWQLRVAKWLPSYFAELNEISHLSRSALLLDSSQFELAFGFSPTPYQEGVKVTADWFQEHYH